MRFQSVVALGFFSSALAAPLQAATLDLPTITQTFQDIQTGIDKLIADVKGFAGPASAGVIAADSAAIQGVVVDGTSKVQKSPALGLMDAISVLGPVSTLSSKVDEVIIALAEKKDAMRAAGTGPLVRDELTKLKAKADDLVKVILASLPIPALLGIVAGPIAKQITDKLEAGVKQWS
jgi:Hydrophobic surface binding protein A